jgi:DNA polymerase III delta subunit
VILFGTMVVTMLELYFGSDTIAVRQKALAAITRVAASGSRVERFEKEAWSVGVLAEMIGAASLFGETTVYLIDTPSEDIEFYKMLVKALPELAHCANTIVVIEQTLLAPEKKKWAVHAQKMEECTTAATPARFDVFAMAEALSTKDKKSLWLLLTKARHIGLSAEEIIGTLWWQLKTLRTADMTATAEEAGMKSYPYDKAKRALRNFKSGELETISRNLLTVYHDGHGGVKDIEVGLEEWVLSI